MKRFFIYAALWLFVAVLWHILKLIFGSAITVWYIKGIYIILGVAVVVFTGEWLYNRLISSKKS